MYQSANGGREQTTQIATPRTNAFRPANLTCVIALDLGERVLRGRSKLCRVGCILLTNHRG